MKKKTTENVHTLLIFMYNMQRLGVTQEHGRDRVIWRYTIHCHDPSQEQPKEGEAYLVSF